MKLCITDLETSGLDSCTYEILEIGAVMIDTERKEILAIFDKKIAPTKPVDEDAAHVNGYLEVQWEGAGSLAEVFAEFAEFAKGSTLMAQNVSFDWGFLQQAEKTTGITLPFSRHKVDLVTLAWLKVPPYTLRSYSLKNLCAYLNVPPEPDVHRSLNGAMAAYECYKKLI